MEAFFTIIVHFHRHSYYQPYNHIITTAITVSVSGQVTLLRHYEGNIQTNELLFYLLLR